MPHTSLQSVTSGIEETKGERIDDSQSDISGFEGAHVESNDDSQTSGIEETKEGDTAANTAASMMASMATIMAASNYATDDPLLVDVFPTTKLHEDMIAPKVNGVYETDNDGLPKVSLDLDPRVCWPFTECKHQGWNQDRDRRIMLFTNPGDSISAPCCNKDEQTSIHKNYLKILQEYIQKEVKEPKDFSRDCWDLMNTRISIDESSNGSIVATDTFFRSMAMTHYGTIKCTIYLDEKKTRRQNIFHKLVWIFKQRSNLTNQRSEGIDKLDTLVRGEREAVWYFKIGALGYKIPFCKYLYGHALIYGIGGIKKDILKGIGFLHDAGTELLIAEAFFELGIIYEHGMEISTGQDIAKDHVKARHFYQDSIRASKRNIEEYEKCVWVPEIRMITGLLCIDSIHLEEDLVQQVEGMHYSWIILGHSFLFGTAASFATYDQPQHYSPLLILLPILGIVLAGYSIFDNFIAWDVIDRNHNKVEEMLRSKYMAYNEIISFIKKKKEIETMIEEEISRNEQRDIMVRFMNHQRLAVSLIWISVLSLVIWLLLLLNESYSLWYRCSIWWYTPCLSCKHSDNFCPEDNL